MGTLVPFLRLHRLQTDYFRLFFHKKNRTIVKIPFKGKKSGKKFRKNGGIVNGPLPIFKTYIYSISIKYAL
jgi:hypothetical protein